MKGHLRQRGAKSWELKFDLGRDPATGRRRIRYVSFKGTKREAQTELGRLIGQGGEGAWADPGKITTSEYLESWLRDHAATEVSAKTCERYDELLRLHVIPNIGEVRLSKLGPIHVQGLRAKLLTEGRRPRQRSEDDEREPEPRSGLAPQTVKHVHRVLRRALKQAVKLRLLAINPTDAVDAPKVERKEIRVLSDVESAQVLFAARGDNGGRGTRMYVPILVALTTGLRRGELLALRWEDLDFENGLLSVCQSLEETKAGLRLKPPKTKRSRRTITLPAVTVAALKEHYKAQLAERLRVGVRGDYDALVFSTRDPETLAPCPIRPRNVTKEFTRICNRAGVKGANFHGLRHTHITNLLRSNVHPKIASERAGHSSVAITLDIYSHAVPNMQADAALLVDANIRGILGS